MPSFSLQKATFYKLKGHQSHAKRWPFATQFILQGISSSLPSGGLGWVLALPKTGILPLSFYKNNL